MTKKSKDPRIQLFHVARRDVEDILAMSDDELLKDVEEYGDMQNVGKLVDDAYLAAKLSVGKSRLAAAKDALEKRKHDTEAVKLIDVAKARTLLQAVASNDPQFQKKYTLAARGLQDLSDAEVLSIISELVSLGAFPDGWNL